MVATWGGYVFVLNLIGVHAGLLFLFGRYSTKLYRAYTAFYFVGTILAVQIPVVGMTPLKSLEQLGPCLVFLGFQVIELMETYKRRRGLSPKETRALRIKVILFALISLLVLVHVLNSLEYFGPVSSRVRALFIKHTKTGNPLVDSVAEHQPAQKENFSQYLGLASHFATFGLAMVSFRHFHDSSSFLILYGLATYYFSFRMVRLILLTAPVASALAGMVLGRMISIIFYNFLGFLPSLFHLVELDEDESESDQDNKAKLTSKKNKKQSSNAARDHNTIHYIRSNIGNIRSKIFMMIFGLIGGYAFLREVAPAGGIFYNDSYRISEQLANPSIMMKGRLNSGETVVIDDYREW